MKTPPINSQFLARYIIPRFIKNAANVLHLGVPLMVGQVALVGMGVTDTIMAGQASVNDLAGLAIGNGIWLPISMFLIGLIWAISPTVAQLYGAKRYSEIGFQFQQGLWMALGMSLVICLLMVLSLHYMDHLPIHPTVAQISQDYLMAIVFGIPGMALFVMLRSTCEGMGSTRPTMLITLCACLLNIPLDYAMVFGVWGFPALGGVGCGWATSLLYWAMFCGFLIYTRAAPSLAKSHLYRNFALPHWQSIQSLLQLGLPISLGVTAEVAFFSLIALFLAPLGALTIGAHQIALNVGTLIFMIPMGMSHATGILAAQHLGTRDAEQARFIAWSGVACAALIAGGTAIITFSCRELIVALYTQDQIVVTMASNLLCFVALYQVLDAIQVVAWGSLRGYKDTRMPMLMQLFVYWCICFPLSYSLAYTTFWGKAFGLYGFWIGIGIALSLTALLFCARLNRISHRAIE
ncbi:MAG: MATE family efflux transporter [Pseudomonadales bacterium]